MTAPAPQARTVRQADDLDKVLTTTKPRGWWALAAITVVIVVAILWAVLSSIPQQITFTAVIDAETYSKQIVAPAAGVFASTSTPATISNEVKKGQVLARIAPLDGGDDVDIRSPADGLIQNVDVSNGQTVTKGQTIGVITESPPDESPLVLVAYVPSNELSYLPEGSDSTVTITDPVTEKTYQTQATTSFRGVVPANPQGMLISSNSQAVVDDWLATGDGTVYAVGLKIPQWNSQEAGFTPQAGQIASVTRTYDTVHPISIIFGGG